MDGQTFTVGNEVWFAVDSPGGRYSAFFEDDGETGYFYAYDLNEAKTQKADMQIQPTIRVIVSSVLTKHFFETLRPYAEGTSVVQQTLERSKLVARTR